MKIVERIKKQRKMIKLRKVRIMRLREKKK